MATDPWQTPLGIPSLQGLPWGPDDDWMALAAAFQDVQLHELAAGMGVAPTMAELREVMVDERRLHVWRLTTPELVAAAPARAIGPLALHSTYTTTHRVAVWGLAEASARAYGALVEHLTDQVFALDPEATHCMVHLHLTPPDWQEMALLAAGYEPYEVDPHYKPPLVRQIYGIRRKIREDYRALGGG